MIMSSVKHLVLVTFISLFVASLAFGAGAEETAEVGEATFNTTITMLSTEIYQPAVNEFIDYVETESGGRIQFETFIMETLGSDTEVMEMVYHGEIDITTGQIDAGVSTYVQSASAMVYPFAFASPEDFMDAMAIDGELFQQFQEVVRDESDGNLHALNAKYASARNMYSVPGPILTPADLESFNIRIRTPESPLHLGLWEALGATPVGVPGEERYSALQAGTVNALEGGLGSALSMGLTDFTEYTMLTGHIITPHFFIANADWYDSLPSDLQDVVKEGARIAAEYQNERVRALDFEAIEAMGEMGVAVLEVENRSEWVGIAQDFADQLMLDANVNMDLVEAVQNAGQ